MKQVGPMAVENLRENTVDMMILESKKVEFEPIKDPPP